MGQDQLNLITDIAELRIPCPATIGGLVLDRRILLEMFSLMWEHKGVGPEGCLSLPGQQFMVERWREVEVAGRKYTGGQAIVIQHELGHLDGLLINELGTPV